MADILDRLRSNGSWEPTTFNRSGPRIWLGLHEGDIREAADEIERLRAELSHARALLQYELKTPKAFVETKTVGGFPHNTDQ